MANLPSPNQVSGKHNAIYEAYYKQIDPKGVGTIAAMDAAKFLKKSGLSDVVLSRIWDLSDPKGRGCLDKAGFFVSLKLVALAQAGQTINMSNIFMEPPNPPKVGEIPKIIPQKIQTVPVTHTDWTMKPTDRIKYEQLFESLQPQNGLIGGNKVKGVLMDSKLPLETLEKIWDLADQDKDGSLDKHEFIVAMHLVYQALDKRAIPTSLPPELLKPKPTSAPAPASSSSDGFGDGGFVANFPKDIAPPPVPPLPSVMTAAVPPVSRVPPSVPSMPLISADPIAPATIMQPTSSLDWVVTSQEQIRFEHIFRESDRDRDGLVSGLEVKNIFLQSGVPQNCLAHIWALCDTNQSGKLTMDQFALAMWMVERKKIGIEPPESLTPNMIPPSLRGSAGGVEAAPAQPPQPTYANPELEMISKEIDELSKERRILETDIAQKEADIRIKSGEVRSLQSELDTLAATLKQLENQKGEAQKRLDDLKAQFDEVTNDIDITKDQVNKVREQCQKQEDTINEQEGELNSKRSELQKLKDEETALEKEYDSNRKELDSLTNKLQETQLQISQVKAMVTQLLESQRQMNDALLLCKAAIEANDTGFVSDYSLKIQPDFSEAKETLERKIEPPKHDTFNDPHDAFGGADAFGGDAFNKSNGFASDPFTNSNGNRASSTFDENFASAPLSGFDDAFNSGFSSQPQAKQDPFGSGTVDPFGDKKSNAVTPEPGKDDFGSDPFAVLHAPTTANQILSPSNAQKSGPPPRPESPSPALPPKKAKQPPPRPAPPRPMQGPTRPAPPVDGFGSSGGFADFADFDNKQLPPFPPPPTQTIPVPVIQIESAINQKDSSQVSSAKPQQTSKPVGDFVDDPFKDYRYEDPFSIKDPFADGTDGDGGIDDSSSDFTASPDKSSSDKPEDKTNLSDNFKWNPDENKNVAQTTPTSNDFPDDFFSSFNDNFKKTDKKNTTGLDAFGTLTTTKKSSSSEDFNDNFEDEFFKMSIKDEKTNGNFAKFDMFMSPSKFSSGLEKTQSSTEKHKEKKKADSVKVSEKFVADYSKSDSFDTDLQKVLKRSLVDQ